MRLTSTNLQQNGRFTPQRPLKLIGRKLWQLICLMFFEPRICLLCHMTLSDLDLTIDQQNRDSRDSLCHHCFTFFKTLEAVQTNLIAGDSEADMICFSSGFYHGPVQEAVYQIKYLKRPELAQAIAFAMIPPAMALLEEEERSKIVFVPVPLHKSRLRERGFNQAEALARALGKHLDVEVKAAVKRTRRTRPQFGLSRGERRKNVAGAFAADKSLRGKNIILIDDVLTSGSTLYECAIAINNAGGFVCGAVTLARARWLKSELAGGNSTIPDSQPANYI